jgi:hypothetical protein
MTWKVTFSDGGLCRVEAETQANARAEAMSWFGHEHPGAVITGIVLCEPPRHTSEELDKLAELIRRS